MIAIVELSTPRWPVVRNYIERVAAVVNAIRIIIRPARVVVSVASAKLEAGLAQVETGARRGPNGSVGPHVVVIWSLRGNVNQ